LLRVALTKKVISISVRKKIKIKNNLALKLVKLKRQKPEYKNLNIKRSFQIYQNWIPVRQI
jgi:4-amino-4-deoxychorismate lyase